MIGSEEVVRDAFLLEVHGGEEVPHPLAPTGLEVMGTTVRPDLDRIKAYHTTPHAQTEKREQR